MRQYRAHHVRCASVSRSAVPLVRSPCRCLLLVHALFGFQNEVARAIHIDKTSAALVGVREGYGPLKPVVIVGVIIRCRERAFEAEQLGQFDHKKLVIGVFTAARTASNGR